MLPAHGGRAVSVAAVEALDFAEVAGHETAKRAFQIAAAGGHGLLMMGPPGSGKTMLASRMPSIMPPLCPDEMLEAAVVHSVAAEPIDAIIAGQRPFRHPHHSATLAGLVGGGSPLRPGRGVPGPPRSALLGRAGGVQKLGFAGHTPAHGERIGDAHPGRRQRDLPGAVHARGGQQPVVPAGISATRSGSAPARCPQIRGLPEPHRRSPHRPHRPASGRPPHPSGGDFGAEAGDELRAAAGGGDGGPGLRLVARIADGRKGARRLHRGLGRRAAPLHDRPGRAARHERQGHHAHARGGPAPSPTWRNPRKSRARTSRRP